MIGPGGSVWQPSIFRPLSAQGAPPPVPTWVITAEDGSATITSHPTPPLAPTVAPGDGEATLEAA